MNTLLKIAMLWLGWEASVGIKNIVERHTFYQEAREYCNKVGKPLLRIGMRRSFTEPPNGDVTLDIDPAVEKIEGGVWGDEREMPFNDKEFGVCFNEHTLEHLYNAQDVQDAVDECVRVADIAVLLAPSRYSIISNIFYPGHHLRFRFDEVGNRIWVKRNPGIGASMVIRDTSPTIFTKGRAIIMLGDSN